MFGWCKFGVFTEKHKDTFLEKVDFMHQLIGLHQGFRAVYTAESLSSSLEVFVHAKQ